MPRLPRITGRAMIKALGSAGETLGPGLIRSILADCRLDADDLRKLL